jgi:cytochrome c-type biogenesis protein CcmH
MTTRRFPLWTLLGVVLVAALVVGSGALSSSPPTAAQRAAAIEAVVRCPTCEDLSVAQSSAPTAVAVRVAVVQQIAEGRTDGQIKDYLVARYGASIVLDPPATGWSLLVWLLPLAGGAMAVALLVAVLLRRRRPGGGYGDGAAAVDGGRGPIAPEVVDERRRFLTRSLADADAEYLAGDLSDKDYLALRQRDMVRLAALPAPSAGPAGAPSPASGPAPASASASAATLTGPVMTGDRVDPPVAVDLAADGPEVGDGAVARGGRRKRSSRWFLGGAVAAFGAALIVAVSLFASSRQPGQSATGSFAQSQQQQIEQTLAQGAALENQGQLGQAARLYQSVLDQHPDNEVALAQLGWLEYLIGQSGKSGSLLSDARVKLDRAAQLDPHDYAVRLYLGTILLQHDGNAAGSVEQYRQFLGDNPPAVVVGQAAPVIRQAYQKAGLPVPPQVAAG